MNLAPVFDNLTECGSSLGHGWQSAQPRPPLWTYVTKLDEYYLRGHWEPEQTSAWQVSNLFSFYTPKKGLAINWPLQLAADSAASGLEAKCFFTGDMFSHKQVRKLINCQASFPFISSNWRFGDKLLPF